MSYLFSFSFAPLLLIIFSVSHARQSSLYSHDDPLWELDSSNFNKVVLGQNKAWIIEFYNNWCGHCIRFAPTWKQFVREVKTWRKVFDNAVVNCNDAQNVKLCRHYEVDSFPTIKLFWHNANENTTGELYTGKRDILSMERALLDFLETHWDEGVPSGWPNLRPLEFETLPSLTSAMHEAKQFVMLFVEFPDSYAGRMVILDISFQQNVILERIVTTSEKLVSDMQIEVTNETLPVLTRVYRDNVELLFKFTRDANTTYIRDQIFDYLVGIPRSKTKIKDFFPKETTQSNSSIINGVYMIDLENAIYKSLSQEIGVTKVIEGEKFTTLKAFLSVLKNYFPGSAPVKSFLSNFYDWISRKTSPISGEEFVEAMHAIQNAKEYLPPMRPWVGCKGSEPKYRGYPCSLWTLFHTLTVQADKKVDTETIDGPKGKEVLFTIRDYIKNFFTCEECSRNFLKMAENLEDKVKTSQDAVLWLWEAHNNVNRRLSGDLTEDPKHPKIQFPFGQLCRNCQTKGNKSGKVTWDKAVVLQFLHKFYGKQNIGNRVYAVIDASILEETDSSAMELKSPASALLLLLLYYSWWRYFDA